MFLWEWKSDNNNHYKTTFDIIGLIICGPLSLGYATMILLIANNKKPDFVILFSGFKRFGASLATYLLLIVFIILWTLLLIIPGIIACLRYSQTFYILSENEHIGPLDAIQKSKEMMIDNKWKLFCLYCRFIGWFVLCIITLGLATLYVMPYFSVSCAKFYEDLKNNNLEDKIETELENQSIISKEISESDKTNKNTGKGNDKNS